MSADIFDKKEQLKRALLELIKQYGWLELNDAILAIKREYRPYH